MACPVCGSDVCVCHADTSFCAATSSSLSSTYPETTLVDPEGWDDSEEQFESSLASSAQPEHYRSFPPRAMKENAQRAESRTQPESDTDIPVPQSTVATRRAIDRELSAEAKDWRNTISNKLDSYRNKRGRKHLSGDYTMHLDFERSSGRAIVATSTAPALDRFFEPDPAAASEIEVQAQASVASAPAPAWDIPLEQAPIAPPENRAEFFDQPAVEAKVQSPVQPVTPPAAPEPVTPPKRRERKIIEFPRLFAVEEPASANELADPILDRPRIIDVPEEVEQIELPLGDIGLEATDTSEEKARSEIETPIQVAPVWQRIFAGIADSFLVLASAALFDAVVIVVSHGVALNKFSIAAAVAIPFVLSGIYQYLFLVHSAMTPGMAISQLRIASFDGSPVTRSTRRGRAMAIWVSMASAWLGYLWATVDEDTLCWHDKISRTYLTKM